MKKFITILVVIMAIAGFSTLHAADLHGIVTNKDGKPVIVKIVIRDDKGAQGGAPMTTGKDGSYAFKDIKPGSYVVVIGEKTEWNIFVGPGDLGPIQVMAEKTKTLPMPPIVGAIALVGDIVLLVVGSKKA